MPDVPLRKLSDHLFEIPQTGAMRVPGRIYASDALIEPAKRDEAIQQVRNVATLPGIVRHSLAMPDFHWGYGFPIGGVAAFDPLEGGVVSPGGIGYDINCGVRIMRTRLTVDEIKPKLRDIVGAIFRAVPAGVGSDGAIPTPSRSEARDLLERGAAWAVERGYGSADDLRRIEEGGRLSGADAGAVSDRAYERGMSQIGTLGSGNHFLEVQVVDEVYRPDIADRLGLAAGGITLAIHSGSRGLGYQVCDDYLALMRRASARYGIELPDRQLCCAPLHSQEAARYIGAMYAAANFAWVNRQVMMGLAGKALAKVVGRDAGLYLLYDVCHNIGKYEEHDGRRVFVHRKGATRALPPGHALVPETYRDIGQPVFVPGDMGRASYLLVGNGRASKDTFASTCHGAGRRHSRSEMNRRVGGQDLQRILEEEYGVIVMARSRKGLAEEMPEAYKDASEVVDVMERAGISDKVVRLRPLGCVKG